MVGQAYKVIVNIDMPESPQNLELGMFMVCAEMRDYDSMLRGHSCRSAMMRYRSPLIRMISTWALSPLYVLGWKEEFQQVPVEIFSRYLEERQHPITDVYVEIQSQKIQFYTVTLHIVADFTGLRYIMFNWPVLSAIVGMLTLIAAPLCSTANPVSIFQPLAPICSLYWSSFCSAGTTGPTPAGCTACKSSTPGSRILCSPAAPPAA